MLEVRCECCRVVSVWSLGGAWVALGVDEFLLWLRLPGRGPIGDVVILRRVACTDSIAGQQSSEVGVQAWVGDGVDGGLEP